MLWPIFPRNAAKLSDTIPLWCRRQPGVEPRSILYKSTISCPENFAWPPQVSELRPRICPLVSVAAIRLFLCGLFVGGCRDGAATKTAKIPTTCYIYPVYTTWQYNMHENARPAAAATASAPTAGEATPPPITPETSGLLACPATSRIKSCR